MGLLDSYEDAIAAHNRAWAADILAKVGLRCDRAEMHWSLEHGMNDAQD